MSDKDRRWVLFYMQMSNLRQHKQKGSINTWTLSQLSDTSDIKTLGRCILELKWDRESKLQDVNHNLSNIHQHLATKQFEG